MLSPQLKGCQVVYICACVCVTGLVMSHDDKLSTDGEKDRQLCASYLQPPGCSCPQCWRQAPAFYLKVEVIAQRSFYCCYLDNTLHIICFWCSKHRPAPLNVIVTGLWQRKYCCDHCRNVAIVIWSFLELGRLLLTWSRLLCLGKRIKTPENPGSVVNSVLSKNIFHCWLRFIMKRVFSDRWAPQIAKYYFENVSLVFLGYCLYLFIIAHFMFGLTKFLEIRNLESSTQCVLVVFFSYIICSFITFILKYTLITLGCPDIASRLLKESGATVGTKRLMDCR